MSLAIQSTFLCQTQHILINVHYLYISEYPHLLTYTYYTYNFTMHSFNCGLCQALGYRNEYDIDVGFEEFIHTHKCDILKKKSMVDNIMYSENYRSNVEGQSNPFNQLQNDESSEMKKIRAKNENIQSRLHSKEKGLYGLRHRGQV